MKIQPFRTVVPLEKSPRQMGHRDRIFCVGSCFTEHIGGRLAAGKFPVLTNPFGIVYNPISMASCLEKLLAGEPFQTSELVENQGLWHSWQHHGQFSKPDREAAAEAMNEAVRCAAEFLKTTNWLLLTFGSATVFSLRASGQVVANCHKFPQSIFEKRRLSVAEVVAAVEPVLQKLRAQLPDLQVLLTVSPVRHLRDGFAENQRSKATLLLACAELAERLPGCQYFPAYELVLDDLRDYRFFEADMVHPTAQAAEYVWQFFGETYFSGQTQGLLARVEKVAAAAKHRAFNPETEQHKAFVVKQLDEIERLEREFPGLDFSAEKAALGTAF